MTAITWTQPELPGFELVPTIALVRGDAYLAQCRYCGVVIRPVDAGGDVPAFIVDDEVGLLPEEVTSDGSE